MEIFSILVQFFDILLSAFVTLYNVFRHLWREILLGALILFLALVAIRILKAVFRRRKFVKAIRTAAKENGIKLEFRRPPFLSLFANLHGYDLEFDLRGTRYRLKFYPANPKGRAIHLSSATDTRWLGGKLAHRRAVYKGKLGGIAVKLDFDHKEAEGYVNILLFSPTPISVTEQNDSGTVWELDTENGGLFDGVYVFTDDVLIHRLPRLMDGYIDTLVHIEE